MTRLSDAARAEIAAAVKIVREDKAKTVPPKDPKVPVPPKDGEPPPPKDPKTEEPPPAKRGIFWGNRLHETEEK